MPRIPDHIVDQILQALNVVKIATKYVPDLKKAGIVYKGLSPFGKEKTPSFTVWPKTNSWKDFSSGKGGKAIGLIMEMEGLSYPDTLRMLAKELNIEIESETDAQKEHRLVKEQMVLAVKDAALLYHKDWAKIGNYWKSRKIGHSAILNWQLGFGNNQAHSHLKTESGMLMALGIVKESKAHKLYDSFRGRAIFPIIDHNGTLVGLAGRDIEGKSQAKYINSSKSDLYNKSSILYGLYQNKTEIIRAGEVDLVEGYTDVISLWQAEFKKAVAPCGTAITKQQMKLIARYARKLIVVFDADAGGDKGRLKAIKLGLAEGLVVTVRVLPEGADPDDLVKNNGLEAYTDIQPKPWFIYLAETLEAQNPAWSEDPGTKAIIIKELLSCINTIEDEVTRKTYTQGITDRYGVQLESEEASNNDLAPSNEKPDSDSPTKKPKSTSEPRPDILELKGQRNWGHYTKVRDKLGLKDNPDFDRTSDGKIRVRFLDIKGAAYRITESGGQKRDASVRLGTSDSINAAYIPPALRTGDDLTGDTLFLVGCPLTAWILSERGVPAIGLLRPQGFLTRPNKRTPHKLISQVIREHKISRVNYLIPGMAFDLPTFTKEENKDPYASNDAGGNAKSMVEALSIFQEAFRLIPSEAIIPKSNKNKKDLYWLDNLLVSGLDKKIDPYFFLQSDEDKLTRFSISGGTPHTFKAHFFLQDPRKFFDFHGLEALGTSFQLGKYKYKYDPRDNSIVKEDIGQDIFTVWEQGGCYWSRMKGGGARPISNFKMKYLLEVKQQDGFVLVQFIPLAGEPTTARLKHSQMISPDEFKKSVLDQPGSIDFLGTKSDLEQIHAICRKGVQEAKSLDGVVGNDEESKFYVFGNGVLTPGDNFEEPDENGVFEYDGNKFFLPCAADFITSQEIKKHYHTESQFLFEESSVEYPQLVKQLDRVHGMAGVMGLIFVIAASYRSVFKDTVKHFPHLSIQAPPEVGKTTYANTMAYFFGNLTATNLRAGVTRSSFGLKTQLLKDAVLLVNEFNLSNQLVIKSMIPEYLVAAYDYEGRELNEGGKSVHINPESAFLVIGQESFWQREALVSRCVVVRMEGTGTFTDEDTAALAELRDMCNEGLSGIHRILFANRDLVKSKVRDKIAELTTEIRAKCKRKNVSGRGIENWAMLLAPSMILQEEGCIDISFDQETATFYAAQEIDQQSKYMIGSGVLAIFFDFIAAEYGPKKKLNHQQVWLYRKKNQLRISVSGAYKAFTEYLRGQTFGIENISKADMESRLRQHPAFLGMKCGIQIGYKTTGEVGNLLMVGGSPGTAGTPARNTPGSKTFILNPDLIEDFALPDVQWFNDEDNYEVDEKSEQLEPELLPA